MSKIKNNHVKVEETRQKREGYNWLDTLKLHSIISGLLAIISVILFTGILIKIVFTNSHVAGFSMEDISTISLPISFILFILSAELYLSAISFNVFNLSIDLKESLKKTCEEEKLDWEDFTKKQLAICKKKKNQANIVSNIALLLLFIAFFCISPAEFGFFVFLTGIGYLIWQFLNKKE